MLEEQLEIFRRLGLAVDAEKFADQAHVRAPGEFHFFRSVVEMKMLGKRLGERRRARAAGVDERAVNVEKNQPNHACGKYQSRRLARVF